MATQEDIFKTIYSAIDSINEQLPSGDKIAKSHESCLYGESGALDSVGLVTLIMAVEQEVEQKFGVSVPLADLSVLADGDSPFRNVASLARHIEILLKTSTDH